MGQIGFKPDSDVAGIILAGGLGTRMGGVDKALLQFGSATLLKHVMDRFLPQCATVALNANSSSSRFDGFGLQVIGDPVPGHPGPLAGILAGMDWAADQGKTLIATVAADTPFLPTDLVDKLLRMRASEGKPIALAASPDAQGAIRTHPTFGIWPVALRDDLRSDLVGGARGVGQWAEKHGVALTPFSSTPIDPFTNVNTPADMNVAEILLAKSTR